MTKIVSNVSLNITSVLISFHVKGIESNCLPTMTWGSGRENIRHNLNLDCSCTKKAKKEKKRKDCTIRL